MWGIHLLPPPGFQRLRCSLDPGHCLHLQSRQRRDKSFPPTALHPSDSQPYASFPTFKDPWGHTEPIQITLS